MDKFDRNYALNYARRAVRKYGPCGYDDSDAEDVAQMAALNWHQSRVGRRTPLDVVLACRYAVREFRRQRGRRLDVVAYSEYHEGTTKDSAYSEFVDQPTYLLIVRWLASGATQAEIAERLGVSQQTVSRRIAEIRETL